MFPFLGLSRRVDAWYNDRKMCVCVCVKTEAMKECVCEGERRLP